MHFSRFRFRAYADTVFALEAFVLYSMKLFVGHRIQLDKMESANAVWEKHHITRVQNMLITMCGQKS